MPRKGSCWRCEGAGPRRISGSKIGYTRFIVKRLVDIDDDLLERAQNIAGTGTIKETVNVALKRLVDDEKVLRHIERVRGSGALGGGRVGGGRGRRPAHRATPY